MSKVCEVPNEYVQIYIDRVSSCHIAEKVGEELLLRVGVMFDGVVAEMHRMEILSAMFLGIF